jgi:hypothetical protein
LEDAILAALKCIAFASADVAKPTLPMPEVLASGTIRRKDTTVDIEFLQGEPSGSNQLPDPKGLSTHWAFE